MIRAEIYSVVQLRGTIMTPRSHTRCDHTYDRTTRVRQATARYLRRYLHDAIIRARIWRRRRRRRPAISPRRTRYARVTDDTRCGPDLQGMLSFGETRVTP